MSNKVAVYTGTRNLYPHMLPAVKALLANSDVDKVWLLIEDDEFPYELPEIDKTKNMSYQKFIKPDNPNFASHFTYMAMIRVAFTKIFPDLDRILSLDVDTIPINDISDVWNLPIDDYYFAACQEPDRSKDGTIYTNAGVCLQNLKKLRESGMDDLLIDKLNTERHQFLDQDVQNIYLQDAIYDMPSMYNVTEYCLPTDDPRIIHYAGIQQWYTKYHYLLYYKYSWQEIMSMRKRRYGK